MRANFLIEVVVVVEGMISDISKKSNLLDYSSLKKTFYNRLLLISPIIGYC